MNTIKKMFRNRINHKTLITVLPCLFFITSMIYGQEDQSIKRRVHKDAEGKIFYMIEYYFDEQGRKISGVEHFSGKSRQIQFRYDRKGNLIQELMGSPKTDSVIEVIDYNYNESGCLIEKSYYFMSSQGEKTILESIRFEYDDSGNLIREAKSETGSETFHEYTYDASGKKVNGIIKNDEQGIIARLKYFYNKKGYLQEVTAIQPDSETVLWKEIFQYDSRGRISREDHIFSQSLERPGIVKLYEYNQYGKKSRELYLVEGEVKVEIIYQYE